MTDVRPDEALLQAASLAFAILRFEEGAAHPSRGATPPDSPRLGEEAYMFAPSWPLITVDRVPPFLASLSSPAVLVPSTTRGVIALLLLDELSGERAAAVRHDLANQGAGLDHIADQLSLTEDSSILLEFAEEAIVVSLAVVRRCFERFVVHVGWSISPLEGDQRATAQLNLFRSDGANSGLGRENDSSVAITSDVPIVYHADGDMVLAALRRHVPTLVDIPPETRVDVWLVVDEDGRVEKTAVSTKSRPRGRRTMGQVLLEPFPGENLRKFESAGPVFIPAGHIGPNKITVWWLQRRADVKPDAERGIYQFDSVRLLPRSIVEDVVKQRYPTYARVGLIEMQEIPHRPGNAPFDPTPEECIVPWFIANDDGTVLETWLGPYLQHSLIARQMIQARHVNLRFASVRIGQIRAENGTRPPIVWAIVDPSSPLP